VEAASGQRPRTSRGLLHYYFGAKERLLAEVVRRDCELRMRVIDVVFSMADGVAMRMLTERGRDFEPSVRAGVRAVRALID